MASQTPTGSRDSWLSNEAIVSYSSAFLLLHPSTDPHIAPAPYLSLSLSIYLFLFLHHPLHLAPCFYRADTWILVTRRSQGGGGNRERTRPRWNFRREKSVGICVDLDRDRDGVDSSVSSFTPDTCTFVRSLRYEKFSFSFRDSYGLVQLAVSESISFV